MRQTKRTRRAFLRTVAGGAMLGGLAGRLAGGGAAARGRATGPAKRPNFLIVIADDVTYSDIGCYGGKNVKTPQIDGFAKQGMRFRYAYVAMSMCCPYPIRTIRTRQFRYIRNLKPEAEYVENHMEQPGKWGDYWEPWKAGAAADRGRPAVRKRARKGE